MVIEIGPQEVNVEPLVLRIFMKSIELLGGLKQLAEFRTLTWLPSIARAAYAVVLKEEFNKIEDEIAKEIGLTRQTVRNILRADPEMALRKIEKMKELLKTEGKELKVHTAGGIAKLAYKLIKEGQEESNLFLEFSSQILESLSEEVPWAYKVLKAIKERGVKFPIRDASQIIEKLSGIKVKDKDISELADKIQYPINNPAILLSKIKKASL
jgi:probable regulatory domain-containing protein